MIHFVFVVKSENYYCRHVETAPKDLFTIDHNNVNFIRRQKWVAWLPLLLFTLGDKNKIMHKYCYQLSFSR